MKEVNFSRFTASKIVKQYLEDYYDNIVKVKVKIKLENNDLYFIVKRISKLNSKKIVNKIVLNERDISYIIKQYLKSNERNIYNVSTVPYFHNLNIMYSGKDIQLTVKKGFVKLKEA